MKQLLLNEGQLSVEEVPAPLVEDGHVLVEVAYSVVSSGTELSVVQGSTQSLAQRIETQSTRVRMMVDQLRKGGFKKTVAMVKQRLSRPPAITSKPLGYSCAGTVLQVGPGVTVFAPGDRVACAGAGVASHAEVVLVPENLVCRVPDGCSLKDAASVALGAIAMQGVRRTDGRLGEIVAVIGLGLLGQITAQIQRAAGCRVIGIDLDPARVELARRLGMEAGFTSAEEALAAVRHLTAGHGVDATIIAAASSSSAILQQAMELTRRKGRVVVVGAVGMDLQRSPFYEKELDLLISCSYGPGRYDDAYEKHGVDYPYAWVRWTEGRNFAEYLRLIASGAIDVAPIFEQEFELDNAPDAYAALQSPERPLAVVLSYAQDGKASAAKLSTQVKLSGSRPDGKIGIAIIGAGSFARSTHLPNLRGMADLFHLRTVVSRSGASAKAIAETYGADIAGTDLEEVLRDPEVDAVLISTRHALHAEQVIKALRAGKHVYCEKPLCLTADELAQILAVYGLTVDDVLAGRIQPGALQPMLMVGFNRRFAPSVSRLKEQIAGRQNPLMALYRVNAGWIPPEHWVHGPEGGGRLVGEGCHMLDLFTALTGSRITDFHVQPLVPRTEHVLASDNASVVLRHADGSVATLVYSSLGNNSKGKEYLEVLSDGKLLAIDDFQDAAGNVDKGHRQALRAFGRALRDGREWPIPLADLVSVARVTLELGNVIANHR